VGKVAAGLWREQAQFSDAERFKIKVGPGPIGGAERFAVLAEGRSMDLVIPDGSILECVRVAASVPPREGDLVIVERRAHDLTEMTCKRLIMKDGEWALHAESTLPEFSEDIPIGVPSEDYHLNDETIRVIGIVVRSYQSHFRR
jgi:SOS-response transcriptional repressor LexA